MEHGFTRQDWKSINTISAEGRLVSKLLEPVDYIARDGTHYRVPNFQSTDYASTPSASWGPPLFLLPYGWWSLAVILHDSAFQNTLLIIQPDGSTAHLADLGEHESNDLLLEAMQSLKPAPNIGEREQMDTIYTGVALGGWHAFKDDRS